jgi:hypothetical protein
MGFLEEVIGTVMSKIFDITGRITFFTSLTLNISEWLVGMNWNALVVLLTSIFGFIYILMKIYDQFIKTRKFKKDNRIKKLF